jgi:lipid A ethanolaminephosphotransferase
MYAYNVLIDDDMLRNVFQTNIAESAELVSLKLVLFFIIFGVLPAIFVIKVKILPERSVLRAIGWRAASIGISLVLLLAITFVIYKDGASFFRNNKWSLKQIIPSNYIAGVYNLVADYIDSNRELVQIGLDAQRGALAKNSNKPTLFIIAAGETARDANFGLGGYERQTTPLLAAQEGIYYFAKTGACNTSTATSLPCMFSDRPRSKYKPNDADFRENVLDILNRQEIKLFWVDNDGGHKGVAARVPNVRIKTDSDELLCAKGSCLDEIMTPYVDQFVTELDAKQDGVLVLHQMGSHGPAYYRRYTQEFDQFTPTCDTYELKDCDTQALVNTYDNSILYTDARQNELIEALKAYEKDYNTVFLYVSDHGESLGENGLYLHATPYMIAPDEQLEVPMLLWLSDSYAADFNIDRDCLKRAAEAGGLSHDNLFHTIMGIMDVTSGEYDPAMDIIGQCRVK